MIYIYIDIYSNWPTLGRSTTRPKTNIINCNQFQFLKRSHNFSTRVYLGSLSQDGGHRRKTTMKPWRCRTGAVGAFSSSIRRLKGYLVSTLLAPHGLMNCLFNMTYYIIIIIIIYAFWYKNLLLFLKLIQLSTVVHVQRSLPRDSEPNRFQPEMPHWKASSWIFPTLLDVDPDSGVENFDQLLWPSQWCQN